MPTGNLQIAFPVTSLPVVGRVTIWTNWRKRCDRCFRIFKNQNPRLGRRQKASLKPSAEQWTTMNGLKNKPTQ